jgi:RHS repeat-associated protein
MSATRTSSTFAYRRLILSRGKGGIGGLLARSHGYSGGNWSTHNFYHADGNGNITYLVKSSQGLFASYRYDPYGNTISSSGNSANVYRFSSKELHVNSGLYYYGYRWYHPNLQRWPNRDPLGESGFETLKGGLFHSPGDVFNSYISFSNDPMGKIDPEGLQDIPSTPKSEPKGPRNQPKKKPNPKPQPPKQEPCSRCEEILGRLNKVKDKDDRVADDQWITDCYSLCDHLCATHPQPRACADKCYKSYCNNGKLPGLGCVLATEDKRPGPSPRK